MLIVVAFLAVVAVAVVVCLLVGPWWAWRRVVRRRVVVVLDNERVIEGVLWARRGPLMVLRDASVHDQGRQTPADGELVVDRARVQWVQVVRS